MKIHGLVALSLAGLLLLVSCTGTSNAPTSTPSIVEITKEVEVTRVVEVTVEVEVTQVVEVPVTVVVTATPKPEPTQTPRPGFVTLIPPRGQYEHPYEVAEEYNKFDKETKAIVTIKDPVGPIPFNLFMAAFLYPGEKPSIPQKIIMRWTAQFTCDTQLLLDDDRLMLLESTDFPSGLGNAFQNEVSVPDFLAIVNAKKVEVQFCDTFEAVFSEDYMNALRDLASRMQ